MLASNNSLEQLFGWTKSDIIPTPSPSILFLVQQFLRKTFAHYHCVAQKNDLLSVLFPQGPVHMAPADLFAFTQADVDGYNAKELRKAPSEKKHTKRKMEFPSEGIAAQVVLLSTPEQLALRDAKESKRLERFPVLARKLRKKGTRGLAWLGTKLNSAKQCKTWNISKRVDSILDTLDTLVETGVDLKKVGDLLVTEAGVIMLVLCNKTGEDGLRLVSCDARSHKVLVGNLQQSIDTTAGSLMGVSCECDKHRRKNSLPSGGLIAAEEAVPPRPNKKSKTPSGEVATPRPKKKSKASAG
jgi:hypothetical protein